MGLLNFTMSSVPQLSNSMTWTSHLSLFNEWRIAPSFIALCYQRPWPLTTTPKSNRTCAVLGFQSTTYSSLVSLDTFRAIDWGVLCRSSLKRNTPWVHLCSTTAFQLANESTKTKCYVSCSVLHSLTIFLRRTFLGQKDYYMHSELRNQIQNSFTQVYVVYYHKQTWCIIYMGT